MTVDVKFKAKLIRCFKNDIRNYVNFHASSQKPENLRFHERVMSNDAEE